MLRPQLCGAAADSLGQIFPTPERTQHKSANRTRMRVLTNVYAEVDLEMKAKALSAWEIPESRPTRPWHRQLGLISFLKELQREP